MGVNLLHHRLLDPPRLNPELVAILVDGAQEDRKWAVVLRREGTVRTLEDLGWLGAARGPRARARGLRRGPRDHSNRDQVGVRTGSARAATPSLTSHGMRSPGTPGQFCGSVIRRDCRRGN